jgi:hypothetical protein
LVREGKKMKNQDKQSPITIGWPKKSTFAPHRNDKPEQEWSTKDLAAEFAATAYREGLAEPGTIPGDEVGRIINTLVKSGFTRYQILQLIKNYFWHIKMWGYGLKITLWANFMGYAYKFKNRVDTEPPRDNYDNEYFKSEEFLARQARMLKLLKPE